MMVAGAPNVQHMKQPSTRSRTRSPVTNFTTVSSQGPLVWWGRRYVGMYLHARSKTVMAMPHHGMHDAWLRCIGAPTHKRSSSLKGGSLNGRLAVINERLAGTIAT
jgi:hypothetical protein